MSQASRILFIQYTNPAGYPPLEHASHLLARAGWEVCFLGTGAFGADRLRLAPHPNIRVLTMPACAAGWRQKWHYGRYLLWVLAWVLWWRPCWIYASDPLACPIALLVSYLPGCRVVYHEHDAPRGASRFLRWCLAARRRLARRAPLCVLPNQGRIKEFLAASGRQEPTYCVWNCPLRQEVVPRRPPLTGALRLLYHGSLGPDKLPLSVLEAIAAGPAEVRLCIVGYDVAGPGAYTDELRRAAQRLGIADRVEFHSAVPRNPDLLRIAASCDVGLALMPLHSENPNMRHLAGASNKPFDYLACGLAVLVSDLPEWRAFYVEPGYGLAGQPEDAASLQVALRWFLAHPEQTRAMGEAGRNRILRDWNYETQFAPVLEQLQARWCRR
jgi:glycosyltransferase involved in cell wall biosynthesis